MLMGGTAVQCLANGRLARLVVHAASALSLFIFDTWQAESDERCVAKRRLRESRGSTQNLPTDETSLNHVRL